MTTPKVLLAKPTDVLALRAGYVSPVKCLDAICKTFNEKYKPKFVAVIEGMKPGLEKHIAYHAVRLRGLWQNTCTNLKPDFLSEDRLRYMKYCT